MSLSLADYFSKHRLHQRIAIYQPLRPIGYDLDPTFSPSHRKNGGDESKSQNGKQENGGGDQEKSGQKPKTGGRKQQNEDGEQEQNGVGDQQHPNEDGEDGESGDRSTESVETRGREITPS